MNRRPLLWVIKFLFRASSVSFILMSLFSLLNAGQAALSIGLLQRLVDGHSAQGATLVWMAVAYLLSALVLPNAFGILETMFREKVMRTSQQALTSQIIQKSARIAMDRLEDPEYQNMVAMVTRADSALMVTYWQAIQEVLIAALRMVSVGAVLFTFYWAIPVALFCSVLPELIMRLRFARVQHKLFVDQSVVERRGKYFADLLTDRESIKEVRTYGVEKWLFAKWQQQKETYDRVEFRFDKKRQSYFGAGQFLFLAATSASMYFIVTWVLGGTITAGALTSAIFALNYIMNSMGSLMWNMGQLNHQQLMVETTMRFLQDQELEQQVEAETDGHELSVPFDITFEQVSYQYPHSEVKALDQVSFTIRQGERIALVGTNGSGKSTLIRLLLGLSRPTEGRIYVNGVPLDEVSLDRYREQVTVAFQDFAHYYRTVRENIGLGHTPSMQEQALIEQAAERSGAAAFVETFEKGYDQQLGVEFAHGVDLSGGQWQKLAIGRAYVRPATCLVMDEPTAALDPVAEVDVYRQFSELAAGRTAILVSHRLGSATLADRIFVLKAGRLVETGTHPQLLRAEGEYHMLFTSQAEWYRQTDIVNEDALLATQGEGR